jgi:uncharacterized protein with PQ loop repeat
MKGNMHHYRGRRMGAKTRQRMVRVLDDVIYAVAFIGPFSALDQIDQVWLHHNTEGVSLFTWAAFASLSVIWLVYGIVHKDKPIIISNTLWAILETSVAVGIVIYK